MFVWTWSGRGVLTWHTPCCPKMLEMLMMHPENKQEDIIAKRQPSIYTKESILWFCSESDDRSAVQSSPNPSINQERRQTRICLKHDESLLLGFTVHWFLAIQFAYLTAFGTWTGYLIKLPNSMSAFICSCFFHFLYLNCFMHGQFAFPPANMSAWQYISTATVGLLQLVC